MKTCSVCGNQCNDADDFCFMCGTKFVIAQERPKSQMKYCMKCGSELLPNAGFCMRCGTPVGSSGAENVVEHQRRQVLLDGTAFGASELPGVPSKRAPNPSNSSVPYMPPQPQMQNTPVTPSIPSANVPSGTPAQTATDTGNSSIYIVEFLSALFKAHNIPVIIYMLMNVIFITLFCFLMVPDVRIAIPLGLAVYFISLLIALSPLGEKILRFQTKCSPPTDQAVIQRIMPIFEEAKRRAILTANAEGRTIPDDIELFYRDDPSPNAFATGRRTICFTKGILNVTDEMLLATFEHEFGHIAHHDTDSILLITVGNLIFTGIITLFRFGILVGEVIFHIIGLFTGGEEGIFMILMGSFSRFLSLIFIDLFMLIWTGIGNLLVLKSSRSQEFKADEFAFRCGKGQELQAMLTYLEGGNLMRTSGLFATLKSSHPDTVDRIAALQLLEATSVPVVK